MKTTTSARLNEAMQKLDLRQVDILNRAQPYCKKYNIKLGRNDLSQYVSGKVTPGQEKLTVLALALGVSETWLMGYDVSMGTEPHSWSQNIKEYFNKTDIFEAELKNLGWTYELYGQTNQTELAYYVFSNGTLSFNVNIDDYNEFLSDSEQFFKNRIETLLKKHMKQMFKENSYMESDHVAKAAHKRTDIEPTEEMKQNDNDIMNDPEF